MHVNKLTRKQITNLKLFNCNKKGGELFAGFIQDFIGIREVLDVGGVELQERPFLDENVSYLGVLLPKRSKVRVLYTELFLTSWLFHPVWNSPRHDYVTFKFMSKNGKIHSFLNLPIDDVSKTVKIIPSIQCVSCKLISSIQVTYTLSISCNVCKFITLQTREMIISSYDILFFSGEKFSQGRLMVQTPSQAMYRKFCRVNLKWIKIWSNE